MRRRLADDTPSGLPVQLPLLPFLDLVFAVTGILLVIFALRATQPPASGRPLAIDELVLCVADGAVTHHADPTAAPARYETRQLPALLERLGARGGATRNLVFAFTADCFATRQAFEDAFARWTARPDPASIVRLGYRPLSGAPEASERLLAAWRAGATPAVAD